MGRLADWWRKRRRGRRAAPPRLPFRLRYGYFRELLQANDQILEFIADVEDKQAGEQVFGLAELRTRLESATLAAFVLVKNLNLISANRYPGLYDALERIHARIEAELGPRARTSAGPLVLPLAATGRGEAGLVGNKMAHLAELRRLGLRVPDGFTVTTAAFDRLLAQGGLGARIAAHLDGAGDEPGRLEAASAAVQELVLGASLPPALAAALATAASELCARAGRRVRLAVRSSALGEDGRASFAGQYQTLLNVDPADLPACYLKVVASLYHPGAIAYRRHRGLREEEACMAVGVIELVDARAGGVMFTRDPADRDVPRALVEAVPGQGIGAADGSARPDHFVLDLGAAPAVRERRLQEQRRMRVAAPWGGLRDVDLSAADGAAPCVGDATLLELARVAPALEACFGGPQDVEWAVADDGTLFLLQARPMVFAAASAPDPAPASAAATAGHEVLARGGVTACPGVACGVVTRLEGDADLGAVPEGAVVVARHSSPSLVRVMRRAHAIVTEAGGATGHMAIVAREFGVPALLGLPDATQLPAGAEITVDATRGVVYRGRVAALLAGATPRPAPMRDTPVGLALDRIVPALCPLHLLEPEGPDFVPARCQSLHDLARFVHEKSFAEMFHIGDDVKRTDEANAVRLALRLPIDVYLFDLGGSLRDGAGQGGSVTAAELTSVPLRSFVAGLADPALRWDRPRLVSLGGFLSVLGESMVAPPAESSTLGRRSFAMASDTYLNFSTRAGYHFSTLDTYCGRSINKNYVAFRFVGGAAAADRRHRRVVFVGRVLEHHGFAVRITRDVLTARLQKYPREEIEQVLRSLGRLTVCCRQLDMLMDSDAVVDAFVAGFLAGRYEIFT